MKIFSFLAKVLKLCLSIIGAIIVFNKIIELFDDDQYKFDVDSLFNEHPDKPVKQRYRKQQFSFEDLFYG